MLIFVSSSVDLLDGLLLGQTVQERSQLWRFVYDYQTLIAGLFALICAALALIPACRQLRISNRVSELALRETILGKIEQISRRQRRSKTELGAVLLDIQRQTHPDGHRYDSNVNVTWAFEMEQKLRSVNRDLSEQQNSLSDTASVDDVRSKLINDLEKLSGCFCDIHTPHSHDFDDPEFGHTEEDRVRADKAAEVACLSLERCIKDFEKGIDNLDIAFANEIEALRKRARQIDRTALRNKGR